MSKKNELHKIIKGQGLDALRPSSDPETQESTKVKSTLSNENSNNNQRQELPENQCVTIQPNIRICQLIPTKEELNAFSDSIAGQKNTIIIREVAFLKKNSRSVAFRLHDELNVNISCAAVGLIADLKPDVEITLCTFDIEYCNPQPLYGFKINSKIQWPFFIVSFVANADVPGFFRSIVVANIKGTELFHLDDSAIFKIE